jgi:hypothetical protein
VRHLHGGRKGGCSCELECSFDFLSDQRFSKVFQARSAGFSQTRGTVRTLLSASKEPFLPDEETDPP